MMTTPTLFEALGGEPGVLRLAQAWHVRCLADPVVAHAFSHGFHPDHTSRVAAYWTETLGGPARYSGILGTESDVVRLHSGHGDATQINAAGVVCFAAALTDVGVAEGPVRERMLAWWADATERMGDYPHDAGDVPSGLTVPRYEG